MVWWIAGGLLVLAYLLGSVPTGFAIAKLLKGIDIRDHGS
ncbi:MAG: glycerol-3-phosphate acyltransferase, partial [Cyanobacteria bacterium P01_D01_bin.2]